MNSRLSHSKLRALILAYFMLISFSLGSCAKQAPPEVISTIQLSPDSRLVTDSQGKETQITQDKPVAEFQVPKADQKKLQYWRHRWKNTSVEVHPVTTIAEKNSKSHTAPLMEYRAPDLGEFIIVDESTGRVEKSGSYVK